MSRPVTAQDFVDSWTQGHRSRQPVLRRLHPRADRGLRRPRLPDRPREGAHGRDGDRRVHAAGHARYPLRRLPRDARPPGRRGHAGGLHRPGGRQGVREASRSARGPTWSTRGATDAPSASSRTPRIWDTAHPGWVDAVDMPIYRRPGRHVGSASRRGTLDCSQVPVDQVSAVQASSRSRTGPGRRRLWPALALYFVGMNMTDPTLGPSLDLRKAVAQSTAAQAVVDDVSQGVAVVAGGYVPARGPGLQGRAGPVPLRPAGRRLGGLRPRHGSPAQRTGTTRAPTTARSPTRSSRAGAAPASRWRPATTSGAPSSTSCRAATRAAAASSSASPGSPTTRRWTTFLYPLFESDQSRTGSYTFYSNQGRGRTAAEGARDARRAASATTSTRRPRS